MAALVIDAVIENVDPYLDPQIDGTGWAAELCRAGFRHRCPHQRHASLLAYGSAGALRREVRAYVDGGFRRGGTPAAAGCPPAARDTLTLWSYRQAVDPDKAYTQVRRYEDLFAGHPNCMLLPVIV